MQVKQIIQERYQLKQQLGDNAGRQTWLAEDLVNSDKQLVVVKLLPFSPQVQWENLKLFEREAQVLKSLDHPRIPKYLDYFSFNDTETDLPWFALVQEYIPGSSLQQLLKQGKHFTEAQAQYLASDILEILIYLHELSPPVFHRDIKPSNLILGTDKQFYLVDFGAVQAKAKAEGVTFTVVGTGGYAPAEQLWGRTVPASDLYALGATLIHLLTATAPSDLPQRRMRLQFRDRVSLTPIFAQWLEKLTDPALEKRFAQARQALSALKTANYDTTSGATTSQAAQTNTTKSSFGNIGRLALLQYGAVILFSTVIPYLMSTKPLPLEKSPEDTAKDYVGMMNRYQQSVFLQKVEFPSSIEETGLAITPNPEIYDYYIQSTPLVSFQYARAKNPKLKSYVGAVFVLPVSNYQNDTSPVSILCEATSPSTEVPAKPIIQGNQLVCNKFTAKVDHQNSQKISIDKDVILTHSLVNNEISNYRQALTTVSEIKHPFFKAHGLIAIAQKQAKAGNQSRAIALFSEAFSIVKTLPEFDDYQIVLLKAIANGFAATNQHEKALEVVESIEYDYAHEKSNFAGTDLDKKASKLVAAIQSNYAYTKNRVLMNIALTYSRMGEEMQTMKILSQSLEVAKKIKGETYAAEDYNMATDRKNTDVIFLALAKQTVESVNVAQQAHYLKQSSFANSLQDLNLDIKAEKKGYNYTVSTSKNATFVYALPNNLDNLEFGKTYVGGVFIVPNTSSKQAKTIKIICQSRDYRNKSPEKPTYQNGILSCGKDTKKLNFKY